MLMAISLPLYQDPQIFYNIWPELDFIDQAVAVTAATAPTPPSTYTFTVTQTPVQQGTVVIGLTPRY